VLFLTYRGDRCLVTSEARNPGSALMLIANAKEATANRWHSHADATANNKMTQADERKQIFDGSRRWLESSELANPARRRSERILRPSACVSPASISMLKANFGHSRRAAEDA